MLFVKAKALTVITIITTAVAAVPIPRPKDLAGEIQFPVSNADLGLGMPKSLEIREDGPPLDPDLLNCPGGEEPVQTCYSADDCELTCEIPRRFN